MIQGILGRKVGMTHVFKEDGRVVGATVIEAGPCVVTQVKTMERDGYQAVQLGFGPAKKLNKPELGHLKGVEGKFRYLQEVRLKEPEDVAEGQKVDASIFKSGDLVDVIGLSKGKGFAGGVKRHHFKGGPKTHGQSDRLRAPGSIGSTTTPGHVKKGLRMAGHMGDRRSTVQNLQVVDSDPNKNMILVNGSVPGARNSLVMVQKAIKARK